MRVLVAPQKVGTGMRAAFRSIARIRPRIVGLTELDLGLKSYIGTLSAELGKRYKVLSKDLDQHSQEIPACVRVGLFTKVLSFRLVPLSPNVGTLGVGNDRWLAVVKFRRFSKTYVWLHTHTDARIQNLKTGDMLDNERVRVTAKAFQTIESLLSAALADPDVGGRVLLTGDLNMLPVPRAREWEHSPQAIFRRCGMTYRNTRVIYLAWGPGLSLDGQVETIPAHTARNPSDHGWLLGRFRPIRSAHA